MRTLIFPKELIEGYYGKDFGTDLRQYFEIKPMVGHREIAFLAHLDRHFNPKRKCSGLPARRYSLKEFWAMPIEEIPYVRNETEKNFIFAGLFYFMVLVPQTLRKMFGQSVEYDFYRCTGWPLVSAGLGGYLPPKEMLEEATLYPNDVERTNFHRMLEAVGLFMIEELSRFFRREDSRNLNTEAYDRMLANMGERRGDFLTRIKEESDDFSKLFEKLTKKDL